MSVDFLDTNIFVCSFDADAPRKQERSRSLIADALVNRSATISFQVIQEFLNVATRMFAVPMDRDQAARYLRDVLMPLCTVWPSRSLYALALDIQLETGFGFYDSLIVAGALEAGCDRLLTDTQAGRGFDDDRGFQDDLAFEDGREIRGLRVTDPFGL